MGAVYKRELRAYFNSMTGYVVIAFLLMVTGIFSVNVNFLSGYANFEYSLSSVSFVLLFVIPILTMRSVSEEWQTKTSQLLFSLPVPMYKVIAGKYLAMLTVLAIPTGVMMIYPLILSAFGTVSFATAYTSILGFFLLGAALTAIGLFVSSLTGSQMIAAVIGFASMLACYLMSGLASMLPSGALASYVAFTVAALLFAMLVYHLTHNFWVAFGTAAVPEIALIAVYIFDDSLLAGSFSKCLNWLSLFERFDGIVYSSMFDLTSMIYFISVAVLFVFFTVESVEKRRWS